MVYLGSAGPKGAPWRLGGGGEKDGGIGGGEGTAGAGRWETPVSGGGCGA